MQKRVIRWSIANERLLVELWAERNDELRGLRRNNHILKEIAEKMAEYGMKVTDGDIRTKMSNLRSKYRCGKGDCYY